MSYWTEHKKNFSPLVGHLTYPCTVKAPPERQRCTSAFFCFFRSSGWPPHSTPSSLTTASPGSLHSLYSVLTWGARVRGTYGAPEAGTRNQYVLSVGPWEQAALRVRYVHNAGGWYA